MTTVWIQAVLHIAITWALKLMKIATTGNLFHAQAVEVCCLRLGNTMARNIGIAMRAIMNLR